MKRKLKSELEPIVPNAIGMQLSAEQIDEISQTVYSRFYQGFGKPDWKSAFNDETRKATTKFVKQVVDSITICDYIILKG